MNKFLKVLNLVLILIMGYNLNVYADPKVDLSTGVLQDRLIRLQALDRQILTQNHLLNSGNCFSESSSSECLDFKSSLSEILIERKAINDDFSGRRGTGFATPIDERWHAYNNNPGIKLLRKYLATMRLGYTMILPDEQIDFIETSLP